MLNKVEPWIQCSVEEPDSYNSCTEIEIDKKDPSNDEV